MSSSLGLVLQTFLQLFKTAACKNQFVAAKHLVCIQNITRRQLNILHVARREAQVLVLRGGDEQSRARELQLRKNFNETFGPGAVEFEVVHHQDIARIQAFGERLAQRQLLGLFGNSFPEIARLRTEYDTTTTPQRRGK